ncbi:hypothetical protein VC83_01711 [Pseudogymnoascus destructans]|uniref:Uncharacterized protein n=2 Tax=Pseudogymnoascus destructans TaxID=655981 RepID=L8G4G1_PSED2|nr:uncharacterized protein VC83_01711 [Pseudogymnoascus destructans]ELR06871.1 hypothetical protein GMDG_08162 [Pseudogymnoascus destructans 20631-21]OAF61728.1 hypothetical protein VC83_01711 [Pseudogymnoascus destructans]
MDDPWGSPWADEAPGTATKLDEARPMPIVIATEKELPFDSGPRSPWDDDEDDEQWSANLDNVVQSQRTSIIQGGGEGWSYHQSNGHEPLGEDKAAATTVESPWVLHSHEAEESLKQNLQGKRGEQSFDDPWAQPDVQTEGELSPNLTQQALEPAKTLDAGSYHPHGEPSEIGGDVSPQEERQLDSSVVESPQPETSPSQDSSKKAPVIESPGHEESDAGDNVSQPLSSETPDKDAPQSSRPSLSLSEHSHRHETTNDSLHTSPDGESRPIPVETKDTSKVKELVQLFDGLAVESPSTPDGRSNEDLPLASSEPTLEEPCPAETEDDFGDFEDGVSFVSASAGSDEPEVSTDAPTSVQSSKTPEKPIISRPEERRTFERGSIKFDIDKSIVDQLYSYKESLPESTNYGPSNIDIPITDSVLTVEQRKVWYRISRYGTMRKHNSGDDDAYVRMGWQDSKVREKTLDIVHKWMEEGRLGAGMALGGGRVEDMFSWGKPGQAPNTEALHIPRKASQSTKARQPALHTSPPRQTAPDVMPVHNRQKSSMGSIKSIVSSPVEPSPRFSWSTAQPESPDPATAITSASSDSHPKSFRQDPVIPPISKAFESPSPVPVPIEPLKPKAAAPHPPEQRAGNIPKANDDDDEWGEMVASPTTSNFPVMSSFPSSSQGNAPPKTTPDLSHVGMSNNHVGKHFRNASLGSQASGFTPAKPFDMDDFVPKASNRSSLGDLSKLTSGSEDPWANADFSFFESPSTAPPGVPASKPLSHTSKPSSFASKPIPVAPKATPALKSTESAKATSPQIPSEPPVGQKSRVELEQDQIVRDIINGLPDLSYMLR